MDGLSDDAKVRRWQRWLNPIQQRLADGYLLDLDIEAVVGGPPFRDVKLDRFVFERTPRTHETMYRCVTVK